MVVLKCRVDLTAVSYNEWKRIEEKIYLTFLNDFSQSFFDYDLSHHKHITTL